MSVRPDPQRLSLLIVDAQVDAVASVRTIDPVVLADRLGALVQLAQLHAMPILVTVGYKPGAGAALVPAIATRLPDLEPIQRTRVAAFEERAVAKAVAAIGRPGLIVAGVATDIGVLYAALGASAKGLEAQVVLDACGTNDARAGEIAERRMAAGGIGVTGFATLALGLMSDFAGPRAEATLPLLRGPFA